MKIIGKEARERYIAVVSHSEIEKFLGLYYASKDRLAVLEVGDEVDLGAGHDHAREIKRALEQVESFVNAHQKITKAITEGLSIAVLFDDIEKGRKKRDA